MSAEQIKSQAREEHVSATRQPGRYGDLLLLLLCGIVLGWLVGLSNLVTIDATSPIAWFFLIVRIILGLAFVLYIPGYLLQGLFFLKKADIDRVERIGLSLGLSVALVTLLALVLNSLAWGLSASAILIGQGVMTAVLMAVTVIVRRFVSAEQVYVPDIRPHLDHWWAGLGGSERRMMVVMAGILFLALMTAAYIFLVPSKNQYMTEFYILGQEGLAEDYPREITAGQKVSITTGITNREGTSATYDIKVMAGKEVIGQAGPIVLKDQATWEQPVEFSAPAAGADQQIIFVLEREGQNDPYRTLRLWVNVVAGP